MTITKIQPGPGQESVWDYPRPPKLEPSDSHVQVYFSGILLADTKRTIRILETSHPPVYYIPSDDIVMEWMKRAHRTTFCEFKGLAAYYSITTDDKTEANSAWFYPRPSRGYEMLTDHIAFYPSKVDSCFVDGEQVRAQEGDFYGGWITKEIVGPFKGAEGTWNW